MKVEIKVDIPWWIKLSARWIPDFYENMPTFNNTYKYSTRIDILTPSSCFPVIIGDDRGSFTDNQTAYIKVRWRAFWVDLRIIMSSKSTRYIIKKLK
tara:strand:- start:4036 stop:4326 length:291 start_codon:yes stop_codon:yes gene_type:complete